MSIQNIITAIAKEDDDFLSYFNKLSTDNPVYTCLSGTVFNADSTRRCIIGCARRCLRPFTAQSAVANVLCHNDINILSIGQRKTAVFITVPDDRETYHVLISAFVKQSYSMLLDHADGRDDLRLPNPVTYILDEFGSFPYIDSFSSMISASRSRGMRFLLILQSIGQLKDRYGNQTANTIIGNCNNIMFITSREKDLLDYISDLAGKDDSGKLMVSPATLQRLSKEDGEVLVFHCREYPYSSRLADVSEYKLPETSLSDYSVGSSTLIIFDFSRYQEAQRARRMSKNESKSTYNPAFTPDWLKRAMEVNGADDDF